MAANNYGTNSKNVIGKEKSDKPLKGPGTDPVMSARIGGVGNMANPSATKSGAKRGGGSFPFGKKKPR